MIDFVKTPFYAFQHWISRRVEIPVGTPGHYCQLLMDVAHATYSGSRYDREVVSLSAVGFMER
jgi:hypothetical protein